MALSRLLSDDAPLLEEIRQLKNRVQSLEEGVQATLNTIIDHLGFVLTLAGQNSDTLGDLSQTFKVVAASVQKSEKALSENGVVHEAFLGLMGLMDRSGQKLDEANSRWIQSTEMQAEAGLRSSDEIQKRLERFEKNFEGVWKTGEKRQLNWQAETKDRFDNLDAEILQTPPHSSESAEIWNNWLNELMEELNALSGLRGHAGLLVKRLHGHLNDLRRLNDEIKSQNVSFWKSETALAVLDQMLFRPVLGVTWSDVKPELVSPNEHRSLRVLETAIINYRLQIINWLHKRTGVTALEIVPFETRFDATRHESGEFYSSSTSSPDQHNIILSIEKVGYGYTTAPHLPPQVLKRALVRRFVYEKREDTSSPVSTAENQFDTIDRSDSIDRLVQSSPSITIEEQDTSSQLNIVQSHEGPEIPLHSTTQIETNEVVQEVLIDQIEQTLGVKNLAGSPVETGSDSNLIGIEGDATDDVSPDVDAISDHSPESFSSEVDSSGSDSTPSLDSDFSDAGSDEIPPMHFHVQESLIPAPHTLSASPQEEKTPEISPDTNNTFGTDCDQKVEDDPLFMGVPTKD